MPVYLTGSTVHTRKATLVPQESCVKAGPRDAAVALATIRLERIQRRGWVGRKVGEFFLRGEIQSHLATLTKEGGFHE